MGKQHDDKRTGAVRTCQTASERKQAALFFTTLTLALLTLCSTIQTKNRTFWFQLHAFMLQWHLENLNKGRNLLFQALNVVRETNPVTKREHLKKIKKTTK